MRNQTVRQSVIIDYLRGLIVRGKLRPGERLPSHQELLERFGTTPVTVQRALSRLCLDGFAVTRPKIGSFVSDFPPHRHRFGIVFPSDHSVNDPWRWSRYWSAVQMAARILQRDTSYRFRFYHDIDGDLRREEYQQLSADVAHQRLAGVIIPFAPSLLEDADFVERGEIPISPRRRTKRPGGYDLVDMDFFALVSRSLQRFAEAGRKRLALLTMHSERLDYLTREDYGLNRLGLTTHPHWTRGISPYATWWVRPTISDLLDRPAARRPDALFVTDDHLLEPVAQALDDLGVGPDELMVVGHWNFPLSFFGRHPRDARRVTCIGFDARVQMRLWLECLEAQRDGKPMPERPLVPAQFADEIAAISPKDFSLEPAASRHLLPAPAIERV